mmetsp:Transcript_11436/g.22692  ORF Transcript_11436/g.22692 Transcript_11436/m.22692 type:complete len:794 (-) Transcript_11436:241-2622(-)
MTDAEAIVDAPPLSISTATETAHGVMADKANGVKEEMTIGVQAKTEEAGVAKAAPQAVGVEEACGVEAGADGASPVPDKDEEEALLEEIEELGNSVDAAAEKKEVPVAPTLLASEAPPSPDDKQRQLDFLLSKATEYSNFIANDLEDLQKNMAEEAAAAHKKSSKKKRGAEGGGRGGSKKSKTENGAGLLKEAQDAVAAAAAPPAFTQPANLAAGCVLKDYQLEGVRWLTSLYENGVSGILADEMGLGKTIQVIGAIAHLRTMGVAGPYLVVAPLATLPNWVREFEKWLPTYPVVRYHGTAEYRATLMKNELHPRGRKTSQFPIIVTSYEVAIRDQRRLDSIGEFTYLVVDEGQRLKNHRCALIKGLRSIRAANRLLLSGTPIQNNLDELWSLLNFVNPQIFDDLSVFQSWFGFRSIGKITAESDILAAQQTSSVVSKLHDILRPFLLRRIKLDVLKDMPPKQEVVVYAGRSVLQQSYSRLIDDGTLRDSLMAQNIDGATHLRETNKQMNHRKNSNHPFLFGEPIDSSTGTHVGTAYPHLLVRASGKFALLDRMLRRLHADKHQVLIFSQMTSVLSVMEDYLIHKNWKYCRIDGSTKIDDRQRQMDEFNAMKTSGEGGGRNTDDDRIFVFLLSTRAGGLGINLATADTCIIFDSDWNPHQDSQAMDRCHRIGQTLPVAVYRLLTVGSVDIEMMEKQISKNKLARMTIAGGDYRKAGKRSRGDLTSDSLASLLEADIKDLASRGDVEDIQIQDEEFEIIMNRKTLFSTSVAPEGKMYDLIDGGSGGDVLGAMNG